MNILIMAQHYAPEEVSGAVLATELAEDMLRRGNQVTIVTCAPNYPLGKVYGGYKNKLRFIEIINHVRVVRVWSYISSSKRNWKRVVNYGTFSLSAFYGGIIAGKPDVIFSYSPPLPLGLSAWLLSRLWKVPWILRVEDLYPDAAIAAGVLRNNQLISMLKALESFIYRKSSHISLISEGFRRNLVEKGVEPDKLAVTPLWSDQNAIFPQEKENNFKAALGLSNQFVILYAGNLGLTSSLEDVLHSAKILKDNPGIHYMLVGEGLKKEALIQYANDHRFKPGSFPALSTKDNTLRDARRSRYKSCYA